MNSKNLSFAQAVSLHKHEHRRFRRAGEDVWCEIHDEKLVRSGHQGNQSYSRGLRIEDALASDWEMEAVFRQLSGDDIRAAMLVAIRESGSRTMSPMEYLNLALKELDLI